MAQKDIWSKAPVWSNAWLVPYARADEPFLQEMYELIEQGKATSADNAAGSVAERAQDLVRGIPRKNPPCEGLPEALSRREIEPLRTSPIKSDHLGLFFWHPSSTGTAPANDGGRDDFKARLGSDNSHRCSKQWRQLADHGAGPSHAEGGALDQTSILRKFGRPMEKVH